MMGRAGCKFRFFECAMICEKFKTDKCGRWDLRSSRQGTKEEGLGLVGEAMYVIERDNQTGKRPVGGEGIKVFGVTWNKDVGIVSCGEDKRVQINKGSGVVANV